MTNVDISAIVNGVIGLVLFGVLIPAIKTALPALLAHWKIANAAALAAKIDAGLDAAAGEAYSYALTNDGGLTHVAVHNAAIAQGAAYMDNHFADELSQLGITPDEVAARVKAHLGTLLARDASVSAAGPAVIGSGAPAA